MPQIVRQPKTSVRIVPREGEIEITLNINITIDGQVATVNAQGVATSEKEEIKDAEPLVPDFFSGGKLKFGKTQ
jgi:hypothetical protein